MFLTFSRSNVSVTCILFEILPASSELLVSQVTKYDVYIINAPFGRRRSHGGSSRSELEPVEFTPIAQPTFKEDYTTDICDLINDGSCVLPHCSAVGQLVKYLHRKKKCRSLYVFILKISQKCLYRAYSTPRTMKRATTLLSRFWEESANTRQISPNGSSHRVFIKCIMFPSKCCSMKEHRTNESQRTRRLRCSSPTEEM
ncbi:hypothetical protein KIN20_006614 [Parelaphostrongylus tenuis]|uniref:Uncharacterized protein n=1 Tax=Parelaphostrongylus tenuis TaxID=148309 RepID=A0AAD5QJF6_PARTN|nr:hypothetical protein KIN20_006614 [Parelaphostrongylus tenuis]